eukprot:m.110825 g.110825  ORF g.110825 m.110825 type:complete len:391 (+) comp28072_c1_seq2:212-1384(+)
MSKFKLASVCDCSCSSSTKTTTTTTTVTHNGTTTTTTTTSSAPPSLRKDPVEVPTKSELNLSSSILDTIGDTPTVELSRLVEKSGLRGRILAKLEYFNPGFSKKDRIASRIIADALNDGLVKKGDTVVELTSGNTGTGLAIACSVHGLKFVAIMSKGNSMERARMMSALGAEVILVPQCSDSVPGQVSGADLDKVKQVTFDLVKERKAFRADQFLLEGSFSAHFEHTGPELWRQSGKHLDGFVDYAGSGGTFAGCAAYLKQVSLNQTKCFLVEPATAAVLSTKEPKEELTGQHKIQGGGYSIARADLPILNKAHDHIDGYLTVTDEEAIEIARRLASEEGIFGGFSGGANVAAALQVLRSEWAQTSPTPVTIGAIICDSGLKYLSTDLYP